MIYTSEDFEYNNYIEYGVGFHSKEIYKVMRNEFTLSTGKK